MRKQRRVSFNQLVNENKKSLINNKEEMEKIDKKVEDKQVR